VAYPTDSTFLLFSCLFCHNPHSTALPSSNRYDKRYEGKVLKNIRLYQLTTRTWWCRGNGGGHKSSHRLQY